ncbi:MAG: hypothetical protein ACI9VT_000179 [Psychroserpens sp.]|jgi:hypothetical protein
MAYDSTLIVTVTVFITLLQQFQHYNITIKLDQHNCKNAVRCQYTEIRTKVGPV